MYLVCVCVTPKRNGITREISTKYEHFTGVIVKVAVVVPVKSLGLLSCSIPELHHCLLTPVQTMLQAKRHYV